MDVKITFGSFGVIFLFLAVFVHAQTLSVSITAPSSGSSFNKATTFTLTASVSCSNEDCKGVQLTANLPSGLSTSTTNPQGCGTLGSGQSCTKSWTVSTNSVGTYSITVTASANNAASTTSSTTSVTVNAVCGDSVCDSGETTSSCPSDCPAAVPPPATGPTISMDVLSPTANQQFIRGEKMLVKVKVTSGGALIDADVVAEIFSQTIALHDDGLHNDDKTNDGIYAAEIEIKQWHEGSYKMIVSAPKSGYTGTTATREIVVNPLLKINATFNKTEYSKGEKLILIGDVKGSLNRTLKGGNLDVEFSLKQWKSSKNIQIGVAGNFLIEYLISFGDPEGIWDAKMNVKDQFNNSGSSNLTVNVKTPAAGSFLYVKFLTPVESLTYSRGETIKFAVEVTDVNKPVSNANVSIKTPGGDILQLNETASGTYSAEYSLGYDAPVGNISLVAEGIKETEGKFKGGGNFIPIVVKPVALKLDLLSPTKSDFVAGETVSIEAKALYPDGTTVSGASVFVESPKEKKIFLKEKEKGFYTADYLIQTVEEGSWQMQLKVEDAHGNLALAQKAILIGEITLFYLMLKYWYLVAIGASPFAYLGYRLTKSMTARNRLGDMIGELKRVVEMKKEAQTKYYSKCSIDKATYDSLMKEYEQKEQDLKTKIAKGKKK